MHPQQRHARFNLIVILIATVLALPAYAILFMLYGPKTAVAAFGFFGICGLLGFGALFYRKQAGQPVTVMDERDEDIRRKAMLIGWGVVWLFWGLLCMGPWFYVTIRYGLDHAFDTIFPLVCLPHAYAAALIVQVVAWSIAVLVLYGKGAENNDI